MDEITLLATTENADKIIDFVVDKLTAHKINLKIINDISIALDEILSNIVNYGYKDKKGDINLSLDINDKEVTMIIKDNAIPYNLLKKEQPKLEDNIKDRPIGGLGIYISITLMNNIEYNYINNQNVLTIKKKL